MRFIHSPLLLAFAATATAQSYDMLYELPQVAPETGFGDAIAMIGDIDGDLADDFAVGAPGNQRIVYMYSGRTGKVLWSFPSTQSSTGRSVEAAGDVNRDGTPDVVIGAAGAAWVVSGEDGSVLHGFTSPNPGDEFGTGVGGAGDANGDGFPDVIVGAPATNVGAGRAYVYSGVDGTQLFAIDGDDISDWFGHRVAFVGDTNDDGHDDFAVSATFDSDNGVEAGSVEVYSGADGTRLHRFEGDTPDDRLGWGLDTAGDFDGDGHADVLVTTFRANGTPPLTAGLARVYSGATGAILLDVQGDTSTANLGAFASYAGDFNGDGRPDIAVSSFYPTVSLHSLADPSTEFGIPVSADDFTAASVVQLAAGLDLDGNGLDDVLVVQTDPVTALRRIRAYPGQPDRGERVPGLASTEWYISAEIGRGGFDADAVPDFVMANADFDETHVRAIAGADGSLIRSWGPFESLASLTLDSGQDIDGDSIDDVIIGSYFGQGEGIVRLLSTSTGAILRTHTGNPGDLLGAGVAMLDDVNADGRADYAIGANEGLGNATGYVECRSGIDGSLLWQLQGSAPLERFGGTLENVGDVDNDGVSDLAIGTATGNLHVVSGTDGSTLHTFTAVEDWITHAAGLGDIDDDGFDDVAVGGDGDLVVYSGVDGSVIYSIPGIAIAVPRAGPDFDGDGYRDFLVDDTSAQQGGVTIHSGRNGEEIETFFRTTPSAYFGSPAALVGDLDGDGFSNVIIGSRDDGGWNFDGPGRSHPTDRVDGVGCLGAGGRMPSIGWRGTALLGEVSTMTLRAAAPDALTQLYFGTPSDTPLDILGLTGCRFLVTPFGTVDLVTDATGRLDVEVGVPDVSVMIGLGVAFQMVLLDPGAPHPLPVSLSDRLTVQFGV